MFGSRLFCHACFASCSIKSPHVRWWTQSICCEISSEHEFRPAQVQVQNNAIRVGLRSIHHSHDIRVYRGLNFCKRCGGIGTFKLVKLARPCCPPSYTAKYNRDRILAGKLPQGHSEWPIERLPPIRESTFDSTLSSEEQAAVWGVARAVLHLREQYSNVEGDRASHGVPNVSLSAGIQEVPNGTVKFDLEDEECSTSSYNVPGPPNLSGSGQGSSSAAASGQDIHMGSTGNIINKTLPLNIRHVADSDSSSD